MPFVAQVALLPADPAPGAEWTGPNADIDCRLALTRAERLEFINSISPREASLMTYFLLNNENFDDARTFAITTHFGAARVAEQNLIARYESLRQLWTEYPCGTHVLPHATKLWA